MGGNRSFTEIERLRDYVNRLCSCSSHGGRVIVSSKEKCVLSDVGKWTDEMSMCVKNKFPTTEISIHHTTASLTHFCVVFHLQPARTASWFTIVFTLLMLAGLAALAKHHHIV